MSLLSPAAATPVIFVFSLGDPSQRAILQPVHGHLMDKLAEKSDLKQAGSARDALDLINGDNDARAIFVTDPGITTAKNNAVSDKVVEFARNGGTVVLGGSFSSFIRPSDLHTYFTRKWGLPWKAGSYHRTTVALNRLAEGLPRGNLPSSYSQKAVFLANVDSKAAWYLPTEDSVLESNVFFPEPVANTSETPIVCMKVGKGWLGYIGDVNGEDETDAVVLGMLGLV
jgi:hypothetical protein